MVPVLSQINFHTKFPDKQLAMGFSQTSQTTNSTAKVKLIALLPFIGASQQHNKDTGRAWSLLVNFVAWKWLL